MQALLPSYLEMSLEGFARQRERLQKDFGAFGGADAIERFQDQVRQNLQMFDRAGGSRDPGCVRVWVSRRLQKIQWRRVVTLSV